VTAKESGIQLTDVWHAYASRGVRASELIKCS